MSRFSVPTRIDGPLAVIGDVHGHRHSLTALLDLLLARPDFQDRWIVFAGDFVDRGPDPRGVVQAVLDLRQRHSRVSAVMGNHELAFLGALGLFDCPASNNWDFRYAGSYDSRTTCVSYVPDFTRKRASWPRSLGESSADIERRRAERAEVFAAVRHAMPPDHRDFLLGLPWVVEHPDYLVVHAGLEPDRPTSEQLADLRAADLTRDRPAWLFDRTLADTPVPPDCPLTVVSGHVPIDLGAAFAAPRRVLIDGGSGYPGRLLAAALLPECELVCVDAEGRACAPR